nr:hypothetical protein [Sphingomonas sp. SORGH_AS_0879]
MVDPSCATASQGELAGRSPIASSTLVDNKPRHRCPQVERDLPLAVGDRQRLAQHRIGVHRDQVARRGSGQVAQRPQIDQAAEWHLRPRHPQRQVAEQRRRTRIAGGVRHGTQQGRQGHVGGQDRVEAGARQADPRPQRSGHPQQVDPPADQRLIIHEGQRQVAARQPVEHRTGQAALHVEQSRTQRETRQIDPPRHRVGGDGAGVPAGQNPTEEEGHGLAENHADRTGIAAGDEAAGGGHAGIGAIAARHDAGGDIGKAGGGDDTGDRLRSPVGGGGGGGECGFVGDALQPALRQGQHADIDPHRGEADHRHRRQRGQDADAATPIPPQRRHHSPPIIATPLAFRTRAGMGTKGRLSSGSAEAS